MKKILTYGTFDLLHHGHINLLRRAKNLGDHLTVAVSTDSFNSNKSKTCTYPYEERSLIVSAIRYVDSVIPENTWEQKIEDIRELNIDVFVMGHDWEGKFDFLKEHCDVIYLPRTPSVSTTEIIEVVKTKR